MLKRFIVGFAALAAFAMGVYAYASPAMAQDEFDYDYDYTYEDDLLYTTTDTSEEDTAAALAALSAYMMCWAVFGIVFYVVMAYVLMTIGKKVGTSDPAWMAWVPFVNYYYMVRVANEDGWKFILFFIPFVNIVYYLIVWMKIAERRGFENWYGLLVIVPVVGWLVPLYIAFAEPKGAAPAMKSEAPASTPSEPKAE
ncbi:MAG: DUF5684 domain-containing protein [Candidatus Dojkabacteria bacterium]|nr:MAG: DUF5684 domain-containing protein [Candidatus Dojkabacteria bacterium]